MRSFVSGTFVGTGAAINVPIGWQPDKIEIIDITNLNRKDEWFTGMAAGTAMRSSSGSIAPVTTNGISLLPGDTNQTKGFTVGTGSNTSGVTYAYTASRGA